MNLPTKPFRSGKDTVINYFNVLREASNPIQENETGCGSLGDVKGPYPVAYNFLAKSYQEKLPYKDFLNSCFLSHPKVYQHQVYELLYRYS